ncbi:juvenile hormone esterase-like [Plodia interpunctella]|uniref:juvenile hormone esterase-like n=1 Tax=Plodia interpunctella TaxID=58824 RepID=UPI00236807ED|nr:juvenile hormone esterase-like [Plodia interpunctella]
MNLVQNCRDLLVYSHEVMCGVLIIPVLFGCCVCGFDVMNVQLENCTIVGRKLYTIFENKPYAVFWDIPYGQPPIGILRFKSPKATQGCVKGTSDHTTLNIKTCPRQLDEDCLHLSIHMPISHEQTLNSVLVWLHEDSKQHGPDFLIDEDIIVVTISYRTSIFGFLNTEDEFAQGNMGAKDILLALKWIRDKISYFNGDSSKVTVVGSEKSAVLVASLLLSPAAEDLFSRVIIHGGSALSPADYRNYNFDVVNKLYWKLNGPFEKLNRTRLYELLANASVDTLISASQDLFDSTEVRDSQRLINTFGPTVEKTKPSFMSKPPTTVYKRKLNNNNVAVMMGYTTLDSLYKLHGFEKNRKLLKNLNYNFQYVLPFEGSKDEFLSKRYKKIRRSIMDFYFVNGTIGEGSLRRYAKYVSDQVIYPVFRQARLQAEVSPDIVYLYRFSFKGAFNVVWDITVPGLEWRGATAGDEICYLFKCKSVNGAYNSTGVSNERHFIKKIARLLANFAKFGNPTPHKQDDLLENLEWSPLENHKVTRVLSLARKLKMVNFPELERMNFWDRLQTDFFADRLPKDDL